MAECIVTQTEINSDPGVDVQEGNADRERVAEIHDTFESSFLPNPTAVAK